MPDQTQRPSPSLQAVEALAAISMSGFFVTIGLLPFIPIGRYGFNLLLAIGAVGLLAALAVILTKGGR